MQPKYYQSVIECGDELVMLKLNKMSLNSQPALSSHLHYINTHISAARVLILYRLPVYKPVEHEALFHTFATFFLLSNLCLFFTQNFNSFTSCHKKNVAP